MSGGQPARILIVDDEPVNIELIANIFENKHDVLFAVNGEQALQLAATTAPDVILLDVVLPGMDGFELCSRLKADPLTQDIPVIFITGLGDIAAETKGLEMGAMDYIAKPINPPVVRMRVNNQIELKRARDQLAQLAATDGLTGLANRRRFDEMLAQEHARHIRSKVILTLIMLDIDHFKLFNDTYGHVRGDDCLRSVAGVVQASLHRATDLAARYGGEEFACILPNTHSEKGAQAVAERIRQGVADLKIAHGNSPTADHVTVSLGVVITRCDQTTTPSGIVDRADEQLYRAKSQGRNRVCFTVATNHAPKASV
ncbi:diguanylate cyclase domain-containing protein [Desulfonatronum thioautotrophicum]|uniref:diguanylate cyclase domain-containing protein n=1 Tax=Desulfonatronum thioautotrophicum TaxID=617001 RepID=UPI0005EBC5F1|nr:diguanylate cyclase [Desulfonatronum thioautotrophicum]